MKRSLMSAICLILFPSLKSDTFDVIEAKKECDKWVQESDSFLIWVKDWKKVNGGLQRK
tara:strand:- start:168 stop:344 length:177 start_codon:yes stop_codon:yes gene_type:complete